MVDNSGREVFGPLIEAAKTGAVSLKVDPAAFLALDKALEARKRDIGVIQDTVRKIAEQESWGLGEKSDHLTSAQTIVTRFRQKAVGGANNAKDTLDGHWQAADELQTLFRTIRERFEQTDSAFAQRFKELKLAQRPDHGGGR